jgi:shikimate kinase
MILKLKRTPGIFLVGFMGSGKTTVGRRLARELGWQFVDLDADIEEQAALSIPEIFDGMGETVFRQYEHDALLKRTREIRKRRPMVLALGGGAFAQTFNQSLVEANGISIWLDCPLTIVRERLEQNGGGRPLARDAERLAQLFHSRRGCYAKADYTIRVGANDSEAVLRSILELEIFEP